MGFIKFVFLDDSATLALDEAVVFFVHDELVDAVWKVRERGKGTGQTGLNVVDEVFVFVNILYELV